MRPVPGDIDEPCEGSSDAENYFPDDLERVTVADLHGWQADPFGLHEQRYFSQGQPTKLVRDGRVESYDPPPTGAPVSGVPTPVSEPATLASESAPGVQAEPAPETPTTPALLPVPPRPGWWIASDGNWYPPETHPDAASIEPGWWIASDGNWYPPESHPDAAPPEVAGF